MAQKVTVLLTRSAARELDQIFDPIAQRITHKLLQLSSNSFPINSRKLTGSNHYRLRIGDYRAIYSLEPKTKTITIIKIAHRRDAYR